VTRWSRASASAGVRDGGSAPRSLVLRGVAGQAPPDPRRRPHAAPPATPLHRGAAAGSGRMMNLGGERSPWKERASVAGNGGQTTTDSVDGARPRSRSAPRWFDGPASHPLRRIRCCPVRGRPTPAWSDALGDVGVRFGGSELHRVRIVDPLRRDGNGMEATAAAMRRGCRRREDFEGCEPRRGERRWERPGPDRLRTARWYGRR
jgi:hypothetical protein